MYPLTGACSQSFAAARLARISHLWVCPPNQGVHGEPTRHLGAGQGSTLEKAALAEPLRRSYQGRSCSLCPPRSRRTLVRSDVPPLNEGHRAFTHRRFGCGGKGFELILHPRCLLQFFRQSCCTWSRTSSIWFWAATRGDRLPEIRGLISRTSASTLAVWSPAFPRSL